MAIVLTQIEQDMVNRYADVAVSWDNVAKTLGLSLTDMLLLALFHSQPDNVLFSRNVKGQLNRKY